MNTRNNRSSAIGIGLGAPRVLPNPDGALDQGDRQQLARMYRAILAAQAAAAPEQPLVRTGIEATYATDYSPLRRRKLTRQDRRLLRQIFEIQRRSRRRDRTSAADRAELEKIVAQLAGPQRRTTKDLYARPVSRRHA